MAGSALIAAVFLTAVPPLVGLNVDWTSFSAFALLALLFTPIIVYVR